MVTALSSSANTGAMASSSGGTYFQPKPSGFMANRPITNMPDYTYRRRLWIDTNPNNGEVTLRCVATDIVRIRPNGEIILTTGGYYTATTLNCMNDLLCAIDCEIVYSGRVTAGHWTVVDNHGNSFPYSDHVVVPATDPRDAQRGRIAMACAQRELRLGGIAWNGRGGHVAPGKLPPAIPAPTAAPAPVAAGAVRPGLAKPLAVNAAPFVPSSSPSLAGPPPTASVPFTAARAPGFAAAAVAAVAGVASSSGGGPATSLRPAGPGARPPPPGIPRSTGAGPGGPPAAGPFPAAAPVKGAWGSAGMSAAERLKHVNAAQQHKAALMHQQRHQQQQMAAAGAAEGQAGPRKTVEEQLAEAAMRLDLASGGPAEHLEEDQLCVVCMEMPRDTVLIPCGHMVLCLDCCKDVRGGNGECPVCRIHIEDECQVER